jgi:hypothetical protein
MSAVSIYQFSINQKALQLELAFFCGQDNQDRDVTT